MIKPRKNKVISCAQQSWSDLVNNVGLQTAKCIKTTSEFIKKAYLQAQLPNVEMQFLKLTRLDEIVNIVSQT